VALTVEVAMRALCHTSGHQYAAEDQPQILEVLAAFVRSMHPSLLIDSSGKIEFLTLTLAPRMTRQSSESGSQTRRRRTGGADSMVRRNHFRRSDL
jgi:hypothetical protein